MTTTKCHQHLSLTRSDAGVTFTRFPQFPVEVAHAQLIFHKTTETAKICPFRQRLVPVEAKKASAAVHSCRHANANANTHGAIVLLCWKLALRCNRGDAFQFPRGSDGVSLTSERSKAGLLSPSAPLVPSRDLETSIRVCFGSRSFDTAAHAVRR